MNEKDGTQTRKKKNGKRMKDGGRGKLAFELQMHFRVRKRRDKKQNKYEDESWGINLKRIERQHKTMRRHLIAQARTARSY